MIHDIIASFNAGELSPYLESRTTLDKYRSGCKTLENYLITPYGPANRRAGTQYLGAAKFSGTRCRLFGLNLSDSNRIVMELGATVRDSNGNVTQSGYMRFWKDGNLMTYGAIYGSYKTYNGVTYQTTDAAEAIGITYASTSTAPVYAASSGLVGTPVPYTESDLRDINIVQINNVVYIVHPSYVPMRLSYWGTNANNPPFTVGEVPWAWAPMLDQNVTATSITPSATTGTITLTASSGIFSSAHVGSYWQLDHPNPSGYLTQNLDANATSPSIKVLGKWSLLTFGAWTADLVIQQSDDNGSNWKTIRTYKSNNDYNVSAAGETTSQALLRMVVSGTTAAPQSATLTVAGTTATLTGYGYTTAVGQQITVVSSDSTQSANKALGTFTVKTASAATGTLTVSGTTATLTGTGYTASAGQQITVVSSDSTQSVNNSKMLGVFTIATATATTITYTVASGATVPTGSITFQNSATATTLTYEVPSGTTAPSGTITFTKGSSRAMLTPTDPTIKGFVRVTGYTNPTTVTARVIKDLGNNTSTTTWREGAFSGVQGYPSACTIHESRVIYAGTQSSPTTIWGSYSNDFENFRQGAYDSDSYSFTLATNSGGLIKWLVSKTALLVGTTQDEWSISSSNGSSAITPTNVTAKKQSKYGSAGLPAIIINDTVIYLQKLGRKLREFVYTWASETWVSNDITALAEHVTRNTIVELAYQRVPDAILWIVRGDGQLVSMTYEREQQVVGFSRHTTQGTFESVATINGLAGEDEVYVLVNRTINGSTVRYIERFKTGMRDALDAADTAAWWYLDCAKNQTASTSTGKTKAIAGTYTSTPSYDADGVTIISYTVTVTSAGHGLSTGNSVRVTSASSLDLVENFVVTVTNSNTFAFTSPTLQVTSGSMLFDYVTTTFTGLSHLEGQAVTVWADTAVGSLAVGSPTVAGGSITLQAPASTVLVGLPYTSTLVPQPLVRDLQDGTSAGRRMRVNKMNVKVYNSLAGEYSTDGTNWYPLVCRHMDDDMDAMPPVLGGYQRVTVSSNWKDGVDIYIRQTLPMPLTIAAIVASWDSSEAGQ